MKKIFHFIVLAGIFIASVARAQDAYWSVPVRQLKLTEGSLPPPTTAPSEELGNMRDAATAMQPYVVLDGLGEAFIGGTEGFLGGANIDFRNPPQQPLMLCVRAPLGKEITGRIFMPNDDFHGMKSAKFTIPADGAKDDARRTFYIAQWAHYYRLADEQAPGGAWFRYRINEAKHALGRDKEDDQQQQQAPGEDDVDDLYSLFTGGRAVSENLQLDRAIGATKAEPETEEINQITGIDVAEIDWKPLIKDLHPQLDPLATILPADQHAVFFSSFDAFVKTLDLAEKNGAPVLDVAEPRSEDAETRERYQRQLGLMLNDFSKAVDPKLVDSVAITGSDPYLRVGSDLTLVLQTHEAANLLFLVQAQIDGFALLSAVSMDQKSVDVAGLHVIISRNDDRTLSSYITSTGSAVIISNSPAQLQRIGDVIAKKSPALADTPEYVYFRNRYPRGDASESAFVILTDATIRRWCGPRWRIADARRTRTAAIMANVQAKHMDEIATGKVTPTAIEWEMPHETFGGLSLSNSGVSSNVYGSLNFMTPISELPIDKVTKSEKAAYERWRNLYQSDWRWAFDPIAARLSNTDAHLSLDLSVLPLIVQTDYRQFVDITKGVALSPTSADPHSDLLHYAISINHDSPIFGMGENFASGMSPKIGLHPFSWVGDSAAFYMDDDPFWAELAKQSPDKLDDFLEKNYYRLPVGVQIDSRSGLKLAAFVTTVRAFVEQTVPQMTQWESVPYNGKAYVRITGTADAQQSDPELANAAIYYAVTPKALIVSLNKSVIEHALDRQIAATQPSATTAEAKGPTTRPWLGENLAVRMRSDALQLLEGAFGDSYIATLRQRSWANIPILNEWKHRYPDQDPIAVHEKVWGMKLIDPAGGSYVWNEKDQTMESTVFGSPASPKKVTQLETLFAGFKAMEAGITFEEKGLRAKAQLDR